MTVDHLQKPRAHALLSVLKTRTGNVLNGLFSCALLGMKNFHFSTAICSCVNAVHMSVTNVDHPQEKHDL